MILRIFVLLSLILITPACLQTENSNALDPFRAGNEVLTIFSEKCMGCHAYEAYTDADFVASGLVVKGDANSSQIYYRLTGSQGAGGPKNMPPGSPLSGSDLEIIRLWITNMP